MLKTLKLLLFLFVVFIFCYFRLKPIYFQTVGYTYDQGRDFLKAAEVVLDKNPTFIGPTTGIQGLFHGAWYYYLLIVPFLIFRGEPIGFYYFNFLIHFASFLFLLYLLKKFFGFLVSLIISLIVATSPYFIFTSIFVGNNIMVLPIFLLFLLANYYFIDKKTVVNNSLTFFSIGLLLGFITEFELAFGLFLIPSYAIVVLLMTNLRNILVKKKNFLILFLGLSVPFVPRIFFELKNNFSQTKIFLSYLRNPASQSPHTYSEAFQERMNLFYTYFRSLFQNDIIFILVTLLLFFTIFFALEKGIRKSNNSLSFLLSLGFYLFLFSTFFKNSFFWRNYYEGIQYLYILLLASVFSIRLKHVPVLHTFLKLATFIVLFVTSVNLILKDIYKKSTSGGTLKALTKVVDYIHNNEKMSNRYCVKVYTPPVIPFTYNYLFLYRKISKNLPKPDSDWVNRKCWFIIESDENNERRAEWLDKNIPRKAKLTNKKLFNEIEVISYQLD